MNFLIFTQYFIQFIIAMAATVAFGILFSLPERQYLYAALTGAFGWIIYLLIRNAGADVVIYPFVSAFALTILSRVFAVLEKNPVTVYLLPGIFPIVPGAGIYYTAYYFITNDMNAFTENGSETAKIAGAIAFGIIFALAIPQKLFKHLSPDSARESVRM